MDGLFERQWPVADAKGAVVIIHGLAEHSGRYDHVARKLNAAGYAAYAMDLRGHGQSVGFPGDMGGDPEVIVADVAGLCTRVRASHDKVFLLAHSMGTLFALPAAVQVEDGTLAGLILSGTALDPGQATLEALASGGGLPAEYVSRDPAVVDAYKNDPLVFYDRVPPELFAMAPDAIARAAAAIPLVRIPVLIIHGTEDRLCDPAGARRVHGELVVADKTLIVYPGLYHEVLNEPERDQVIADVIRWLDAH